MNKFGWDNQGRLKDDTCTIKMEEREHKGPGQYQMAGYNPAYQNVKDYTNRLAGRTHSQQVYRDQLDYVNQESDLFMSELTNQRALQQLFTRPYVGFYCGPSMHSLGHKDLETALQQGLLTNLRQKPCEACRGVSMYRYTPLPQYGNPQREEVIIPPPVENGGWVRGGLPTRDFVRRVDYSKRCFNHVNNQAIHK